MNKTSNMTTDYTSVILGLPSESDPTSVLNEDHCSAITSYRNSQGNFYSLEKNCLSSFPHCLGLNTTPSHAYGYGKKASKKKIRKSTFPNNGKTLFPVKIEKPASQCPDKPRNSFFKNNFLAKGLKGINKLGKHKIFSPIKFPSFNPKSPRPNSLVPYTVIYSGEGAKVGFIWTGNSVDFTAAASIPLTKSMFKATNPSIPFMTYREFFKNTSKGSLSREVSRKVSTKIKNLKHTVVEPYTSILVQSIPFSARKTATADNIPVLCDSSSSEASSVLDNVGRLMKHLEKLDAIEAENKTENKAENKAEAPFIPDTNTTPREFGSLSLSEDHALVTSAPVFEGIDDEEDEVYPEPLLSLLDDQNYTWGSTNNGVLGDIGSIGSIDSFEEFYSTQIAEFHKDSSEMKPDRKLYYMSSNDDSSFNEWKKPRSFKSEFIPLSVVGSSPGRSWFVECEQEFEIYNLSNGQNFRCSSEEASLNVTRPATRFFSKIFKAVRNAKRHFD